jgi:hypothetical protein
MPADMYESIMSTRTRMTRYYARSCLNDPMDQTEDAEDEPSPRRPSALRLYF